MIVHVLLYSNAITPLPAANTTNAVVCSAAVAMVPYIVGKYVVSGVGQMLVLDHKVNLDGFVAAPRLAKMPKGFPSRYADAEKSGLDRDITAGSQTLDFDLD